MKRAKLAAKLEALADHLRKAVSESELAWISEQLGAVQEDVGLEIFKLVHRGGDRA